MSPSFSTSNFVTGSMKAALVIATALLLASAATLLVPGGPAGIAAADTVSDGPTNELPEIEAPRVLIRNYARGAQRLGEDRRVGVARVRCVTGTCQVSEIAKARIRVRGQAFEPVEVIAPMIPLQAGEVGEVEVIVPEAAVERLGGPRRVGVAAVRVRASAALDGRTVRRGRAIARGFRLARVGPQVADRP